MSFVQLTQDAEGRTEMNSAKSCASFSMLGSATCPELPSLSTSNPDVRPRKMHSSRLSEIRWEALATGREQRKVLNLRGLPSKLCTTEALQVRLRAEGLGTQWRTSRCFLARLGDLVVEWCEFEKSLTWRDWPSSFMAANVELAAQLL